MGILRRERDGTTVVLFGDHVVGRMPSCALSLEASFVSLAHALIRWGGDRWEVRDLGSRNGTYVDGIKVPPGHSANLEKNTILTFGGADETWRVTSAGAPTALALPLDGGQPIFLDGAAIPIPSPDDPKATIFPRGAGWCLETEEAELSISSGETFVVAGRSWKFECPRTLATTETAQTQVCLADASLSFEVSLDEEHVWLTVRDASGERNLGERACFYLGLILARQRTEDRLANSPEPGWLQVGSLLEMVPEYASASALNVEIYRLRRALTEAGVRDAAVVIERRRGELRLGTDRVEVRARY